MGFFSDLSALKEVQRIKKGGTTNLSISQIVNLIINLPDAKKNLSSEDYEAVFSLYQKMRSGKTKLTLDLEGYYSVAIDLIRKFDAIAPYEKYSGGNEIETSLLMAQIRDKNYEKINEIKEKILETDQVLAQLEQNYDRNKRELYGAYSKEEINALVNSKKMSKADAQEYLDNIADMQTQINTYPFVKNSTILTREKLIKELKALESEE